MSTIITLGLGPAPALDGATFDDLLAEIVAGIELEEIYGELVAIRNITDNIDCTFIDNRINVQLKRQQNCRIAL